MPWPRPRPSSALHKAWRGIPRQALGAVWPTSRCFRCSPGISLGLLAMDDEGPEPSFRSRLHRRDDLPCPVRTVQYLTMPDDELNLPQGEVEQRVPDAGWDPQPTPFGAKEPPAPEPEPQPDPEPPPADPPPRDPDGAERGWDPPPIRLGHSPKGTSGRHRAWVKASTLSGVRRCSTGSRLGRALVFLARSLKRFHP